MEEIGGLTVPWPQNSAACAPQRCPGEEGLGGQQAPGGGRSRTKAQNFAESCVLMFCGLLSLPRKVVLQWPPGLLIDFLLRKHLPLHFFSTT